MGARRQVFRQTDIMRAAKGAVAAGLNVARIEVTPEGNIAVIVGLPGPVEEEKLSPLELWRRKRNASAA